MGDPRGTGRRRRPVRASTAAFLATATLAAALGASDAGPGRVSRRSAQEDEASRRIRDEMAEPFCYFLVPSDVLGFKDCPEGTQVTFDGAFNTGFGEFDLHAGRPLRPVRKRVKTLHRGYLPIIEYAFTRDGAAYRVRAFAAPVELDPRNNLVNFVRVEVTNPGPAAVEAAVGAAFPDPHGEARARLPCQTWYRDRFLDAVSWEASREIALGGGRAWRGDHLLFLYEPEGAEIASPEEEGDGLGPWVTYRFDLASGESRILDFAFPYVPVHRDRAAEIEAVGEADPDETLERTVAFWEGILASATGIQVPEEKVVRTMKASLIYDLIARDITEDGRHFVQKVNEFQYDHFYPRDTAYFIRTYDLLGLHRVAEESLDHFLLRDEEGRPTGLRRKMPDDWGQSLWSVGAHWRAAGDLEFARRAYPAIPPHVERFVEACADDPLELWPAAGPYDNEAITGHYTGHSFWALLGLREAIRMAEAVGAEEDALSYRKVHDDYRERFMRRLREVAAEAEGYIPPGIDDPDAGFDWANASGGVYPFGVLDPHDPMVTATVETVREHKYREGIMTYGPNAWVIKQKRKKGLPENPGWLHHYETFYVVQTLLARGEQRKVVEDFYSILAHTGSTHSGFEFSIRPWGDRDPGGNRPPHGWFAARFNALLRNMLVREEGETLHLASALSPVWLRPGNRVVLRDGATFFGPVSFEIRARETGAEINLSATWRTPPQRIVFHIPWFLEVSAATVDGEPAEVDAGVIALPPTAERLAIEWRWKETPALSYETAVRQYLEKYHRRPEGADYSFLFPTPRPPRIRPPQGIFIGSTAVELEVPGGIGTIHYTVDGSPAGPETARYEGPIRVTETTTIRAVTVWDDGRISPPLEVKMEKATPRPPDESGDLLPGLRYLYYEGAWDALPDFEALDPVREGTAPTFDLGVLDHREDDFGAVFTGYIDVPRDGVYTFTVRSDDGSRMFIGTSLVVDNDGLHPPREEGAAIALGRGKHAVTVTFFERGGISRLCVSWAGPEIPMQPIPASALFREAEDE